MKRIPVTCAILCAMGLQAPADMPPQSQVSLTQGSLDSWNLDWNGVENITYFNQWTCDLVTWGYLPGIQHGAGLQSVAWRSTTAKYFVRLRYTDIPTSDAQLADFDNDGLSNIAEVTLRIDPLDADTDHDGILDGVEVANNGDPLSPADGDPLKAVDSDGDGLSDAVELARGTSPTLWDSDGDGANDAVDAYPLDPTRSAIETSIGTDTTKPVVLLESPANAVLVSGP